MTQTQLIGVIVMSVIFILLMVLVYCSNNYSLNGIKSKKIGDGQHGTARFATKSEIKRRIPEFPLNRKNGENTWIFRMFREQLSAVERTVKRLSH